MKMTVESKAKELSKLFAALGEKLTPELAAGMNRAVSNIEKRAFQELREQYGIPEDQRFGRAMRVRARPESKKRLRAHVSIYGPFSPLYLMNPSQTDVMGGKTTGGVAVTIKGRRERFEHAFVAKMRSGHIGVFQRVKEVERKYFAGSDKNGNKLAHWRLSSFFPRKRRGGIRELFTTTVPQDIDDSNIIRPATEKVMDDVVNATYRAVNKLVKDYGDK